MIRRIVRLWFLLGFLALFLAGCSGGNNDTHTLGTDPNVTTGGTAQIFAQFDPGTQVMPLPNDVVWESSDNPNPSEVYLAPAATDSTEMAQLKQLVNAQGLSGLSPNMFLTIPVTGTVNTSTLQFIVFRTDDPNLPVFLQAVATGDQAGAATALAQMEIRTQNDFVISTDPDVPDVIKLLPRTPFTPGASYCVVVPSTLTDSLGYPVHSSLTMEALKSEQPFAAGSPFIQLEALRAAFNDGSPSLFDIEQAITGAATGTAWTRDNVLVMWTFNTAASTLSLTPTTQGASTVAYPVDGGTNEFAVTAATFKGGADAFAPTADASVQWKNPSDGTYGATPIGIPFATYMAAAAAQDASLTAIPTTGVGNIYFGEFQSPTLASNFTSTDSVPFLLTVPATAEPAGGYPVVIFQHGITRSKLDALPLASTLAQDGYAVLAIDAPLHGDRTPAGETSGQDFFTTNLLQDRANLYQSAIDLWETVDVIKSAGGIDFTNDSVADLDGGNIEFVAQSLGSIIGSVFLSQESDVQKMVLSNPSAMLVDVLETTGLSDIQALTTSLGYTKGTTPYYVFLDLAQWLVDPVDGSYNGIGSNSTSNLLATFAYGDPVVSNENTEVFLTNVGIDPANIITIDPDSVNVTFPSAADYVGGAYQYGIAGKPVVHGFMLSPLFDPTTDTYYQGYDPTIQVEATTGAQEQLAGFLAPSL